MKIDQQSQRVSVSRCIIWKPKVDEDSNIKYQTRKKNKVIKSNHKSLQYQNKMESMKVFQ